METGAISPLSAAQGVSKVIVPPVAGPPRVLGGSGAQIGSDNQGHALPRGVGPDGVGQVLDVFG